MKIGTQLQPNKLYYTKTGVGIIVSFNKGINLKTDEEGIITPSKTDTTDVWMVGGISRHIKDIAETEEEAQQIKY